MKVPFNDLKRIHDPLRKEFHEALDTILDSSGFVGDTVFSKNFKEYTKSPYCITCNSGTDALYLAIKALELEDNSKIMVPAVSYAATAMAVVNAGHVPVFVDVNPKTGLIDFNHVEIDDDIKCIIVVHLFGQCVTIPRGLNIPIIEDCAQAHGSIINGRHVGTIGDIGCFSFYPGKNLGALGDGGACITKSLTLATKMKQYASLGAPAHNRYEHQTDGVNSRMDGMQGLFLSTKLKHLDEWTNERINVATKYNEAHTFPTRSSIGKDVYHVFYTLQENRDSYIEHMKKNGIQTGIHYPISLPELECFKEFHIDCKHAKEFCSKCVSLPMFPYMTDDEIKATLESHKSFPHLEQ